MNKQVAKGFNIFLINVTLKVVIFICNTVEICGIIKYKSLEENKKKLHLQHVFFNFIQL